MKKIFTLPVLCFVLCLALASPPAAQAQTEPPLCGISHTDYQLCGAEDDADDPQPNGISHTDAPAAEGSTAAAVASFLLDVAAVIVGVGSH